jgi:pimeloyl-ACP methyl ester carboxylesterase
VSVGFIEVDWAGRRVQIEHQWLLPGRPIAPRPPLVVFLHEGLGSLSMWRDFPQRLCDAAGVRGLVYSRPGYGRSTPRAEGETWGVDFMHRQADELLPALLAALDVDAAHEPPWLFGHSDGGSIALLAAAHRPNEVAGTIVLAPHITVEAVAIQSIARARKTYLNTDWRERLARHHADPDSAFWGWNDIWLHPDFAAWTIAAELPPIVCPLLAIQGLDDEYGTLEQVRGIARQVPHTEVREWPACGHSPHRDQPEKLLAAATRFLHRHLSNERGDPP